MRTSQIWTLANRFDDDARQLADRHYSRQTIGSPQFVPPGRCLVLKSTAAYWVTSWPFAEYTKHAWAGDWVCSAFRRESDCPWLASEMIADAVACSLWKWPDADVSMVTFVDAAKVRRKRDAGRCFRRAGFVDVGETKGGLIALRLTPDRMPTAIEPMRAQLELW